MAVLGSNFGANQQTTLAQSVPCSMATLDKALDRLAKQGLLKRAKSPTGREYLTPPESQMVLDRICHRDTA